MITNKVIILLNSQVNHMECQDYGLTRDTERNNLNLNPLQRGGVLPVRGQKGTIRIF